MGMDWKSAIKALKAFHAPGLDGSPASMQKELEGLEESLKGWEDRDESRGKSFETWKAVDAKLRAERDAALLQIDELREKLLKEVSAANVVRTDLRIANRLISEFPRKLLEAVLAEQDRCAKIAEVFWDGAEKLNADLRADKTQAEKNMAYMISANIRALRRRESDFAQKPKCEAPLLCPHGAIHEIGWGICSRCTDAGTPRAPERKPLAEKRKEGP